MANKLPSWERTPLKKPLRSIQLLNTVAIYLCRVSQFVIGYFREHLCQFALYIDVLLIFSRCTYCYYFVQGRNENINRTSHSCGRMNEINGAYNKTSRVKFNYIQVAYKAFV